MCDDSLSSFRSLNSPQSPMPILDEQAASQRTKRFRSKVGQKLLNPEPRPFPVHQARQTPQQFNSPESSIQSKVLQRHGAEPRPCKSSSDQRRAATRHPPLLAGRRINQKLGQPLALGQHPGISIDCRQTINVAGEKITNRTMVSNVRPPRLNRWAILQCEDSLNRNVTFACSRLYRAAVAARVGRLAGGMPWKVPMRRLRPPCTQQGRESKQHGDGSRMGHGNS